MPGRLPPPHSVPPPPKTSRAGSQRPDEFAGDSFQERSFPPEDEHLEAIVGIEMDVEGENDRLVVDVTTLFIEPGSPWENGHIESFNGKSRDELLTLGIFNTLAGARVLVE